MFSIVGDGGFSERTDGGKATAKGEPPKQCILIAIRKGIDLQAAAEAQTAIETQLIEVTEREKVVDKRYN